MCPSRESSRVNVPTQVCDRVTMLVRRLFSQCSGLIRKGATRLTSVLESCGAPRGDSTYLPFPDFSVVAGDGGGSENTFAKKLGNDVVSTIL